jgi:truncated hemoglobin YjbI
MFLLAVLLALVTVSSGQTICQKYAQALGLTQYNLMATVVNRVVSFELQNPDILQYFDGSKPPNSTDYTTDPVAYQHLASGLIAFFGGALGCTDPTFPRYTGPNMQVVHSKMMLTRATFDTFNTIFINALASLGVTLGDQAIIRTFLNSFAGSIVAPTICQKYAAALGVSQLTLMTTAVTAIVKAEVSDPGIQAFFNGTLPPGSINFLTNVTEYNRLAKNLIAYFGAALGCNDPSFPIYMGNPDMHAVHAKMPIGPNQFREFNRNFVMALALLGVSSADQMTVAAFLDGFATKIINSMYFLRICPYYSSALGVSEVTLMTTIVSQVVGAELADPSILPYFNGQIPPGSINFLNNTVQYNRLATNLVAFFGRALGCNSPGFPPYTGSGNMQAVHADMKLTTTLFNKFVNIFVNVVANLGVSSSDQYLIRAYLNSFMSAIVSR